MVLFTCRLNEKAWKWIIARYKFLALRFLLDFAKCNILFKKKKRFLIFINSSVLLVHSVAAEFLALCPNSIGITGDGRGN